MVILESASTLSIIKDVSGIILGILNFVALLVGAWFAYWKFIRQREDHPKIEFTLEVHFICRQDHQILVEICPILKNIGLVRHEIDATKFFIKLRYLLETDPIQEGDSALNYQTFIPHSKRIELDATNFPHSEAEKDAQQKLRSIVPSDWQNTFIDPGVTQQYSYVTAIPDTAVCLMVTARFACVDQESDFQGAQKVFQVPKDIDGARGN